MILNVYQNTCVSLEICVYNYNMYVMYVYRYILCELGENEFEHLKYYGYNMYL